MSKSMKIKIAEKAAQKFVTNDGDEFTVLGVAEGTEVRSFYISFQSDRVSGYIQQASIEDAARSVIEFAEKGLWKKHGE